MQSSVILNYHDHDHDDDRDENQTLNIVLKVGSAIIIFLMSFGFGALPYFWKQCRRSTRLTGFANSFSSGIFLGVGIFHLLPEAAEKFEDYFEDNGIESKITKMPLAFIIAFAAYTLILFIEKIAFDSHALIHHESDDDANNTELLSYKSKEIDSEKQNNQKDEDELDENLVEDEIKNLVTTKGKFGSFIQNQTSISRGGNPKASFLKKSVIDKQQDSNSTNIKPVTVSSTSITPYLLLAALAFHGFFEGIAIGLQMAAKSTMSLIIAVVAHKWAEAFTLGISFAKSNTEKSRFVKLILLFSIFTPAGIASGIIVSGFPGWVEAMFFSLSVGTFFYVAITEIIIEEFSVSKHKVLKFLLFLLGSFMIAGLTVWEHAGGGHHHH